MEAGNIEIGGDLRPVTGPKTAATVPAQPAGSVLPGSRAMRAARLWVRSYSSTFPQKPEYS